MSKERELLLLALDFLDPRRWLDPSDQHALNVITRDIELLLAQPEQTEPVAWMWDEMFCEDWTTVSSVIKPKSDKQRKNIQPLYTAPPKFEPLTPRQGLEEYKKGYAKAELDLKREPLSYEHLEALVDEHHGYPMTLGRAIEKAHGITGGGE